MESYKSSTNEIDRFLQSHVWDDLSNDLSLWLDDVRDKLEAVSEWDEVCRFQGRAEVIRRVLDWFSNIRSVVEEEEHAKRK